jgi:ABC-type transport system substrate-binding protein
MLVKSLNRRRFLQLSTGSAASLWWAAAGCAATPPQPTPVESTAPAPLSPTVTDNPGAAAASGADLFSVTPLRIALLALPNSFDPALFAVIDAYPFGFAVYDGLVWVDQSLTPQPMLAESWEVNQNGRRWTFHLRRDVLFHHATPFAAEDVVYTFTRLLDPTLASPLQPVLSFIDRVEADGEYTVHFWLNAPNADLPLLLAAPQTRILPHDYPIAQLLVKPSGT